MKKQGPKQPDSHQLKLTIERLNEDGLGTTRSSGREVLIWGAFPAEEVEATIQHKGQRRIVARRHKILRPSPLRRPSPCNQAEACQGCPLIEMKPEAQLEFKQQLVARAMLDAGLKRVVVPEVIAAPHELGYRTSAKLVIGREKRHLRIGLFRRGSHEIIDLKECPLHHPLINKILAVVREEIIKQKLSVWDPRQGDGLLRYLLIRVSPAYNKALVTLVTGRRDYRSLTHLAKWLQKKVPEVIAIHQNVNPGGGNVILGRETLKMIGAPDLRDRLGEFIVHLGPTSFLQVNHDQAARIYHQVTEWLAPRPKEPALDLYCGIGSIALHLAARGAEVTGVEMVEEAVRYAGENARRNGFKNCRFIAGDTARVVAELVAQLPSGTRVVVNPPRTGCAPEVLQQVASLMPEKMVYVSCNPQTLARDLALLESHGMGVDKVQPFDMFPQTPHVETIALLSPHPELRRKKKRRS